jgi:hypothetical protein
MGGGGSSPATSIEGYGPSVATREAIRRAGKLKDLVSVDINDPFPEPALTVEHIRKALEDEDLRIAAITPGYLCSPVSLQKGGGP